MEEASRLLEFHAGEFKEICDRLSDQIINPIRKGRLPPRILIKARNSNKNYINFLESLANEAAADPKDISPAYLSDTGPEIQLPSENSSPAKKKQKTIAYTAYPAPRKLVNGSGITVKRMIKNRPGGFVKSEEILNSDNREASKDNTISIRDKEDNGHQAIQAYTDKQDEQNDKNKNKIINRETPDQSGNALSSFCEAENKEIEENPNVNEGENDKPELPPPK